MRIAALVARYLLGVMFVVFGLNGFLHFIPMGPMPTGPAGQYMAVMAETHYMVLVFVIQIVAGILFLLGKYVPLALTLIAPVIVNILLYHLTMNPAGIGAGLLATILWLLLFWSRREAFAGILHS